MSGRVREIFALTTLRAKLEGLFQLAKEVYESREDHIHLTTNFPIIMQRIFCVHDGHTPWIEAENYEDKVALTELLLPSGPLLKHLILRRFDTDIRYEFPVELLPHPFQVLIKEKRISSLPPLLKDKLSRNNLGNNILLLNTWECYLFYFASYGVHFVSGRPLPTGAAKPVPRSKDSSSAAKFATSLWGGSTDASTEVERDERLDDAHVYNYLLEDYMRFFVFKNFEDKLKESTKSASAGGGAGGGVAAMTFLDGDFYSSVSTEYAILSCNILEVTLECYLNIIDFSNAVEYTIPSDLVIESLTITLKALVRGLRSVRTLDYGPPAIAHSVRSRSGFVKTTQEELFQQLMATTVCNRLYLFFIRAFGYAYWSRQTLALLRYIIDLWSMLLRPWALGAPSWMVLPDSDDASDSQTNLRAFLTLQFSTIIGKKDANKKDDENRSDPKLTPSIERARREFVLNNFVLYSPTFVAFLEMAQRFNLSHKKELKIIATTFNTWVHPDVLNVVLDIESCVASTQTARVQSMAVAHNVEVVHDTVKEALKSVGDPSLALVPIRSVPLIEKAQTLVSKLQKPTPEPRTETYVELVEESIANAKAIFSLTSKITPIPLNFGDADDKSKSKRAHSRVANVEMIKNIQFLGDEKYRPITAHENRYLVRRALALSTFLRRQFGITVDIRILGAYKIYFWILIMAVALLFFVGFVALLTTNFEQDHAHHGGGHGYYK